MVHLTCLIGLMGMGLTGAYRAETRAISPAVVTTAINSGERVALMVLWRGTPYWFSKGSGGGATDERRGTITVRATYGTLALDLSFDTTSRQLRLQGQPVDLGTDANVVLVDDVDSAGGPRVVEVLTLDAPPPDAPNQVALMLRRSPEAVAFLRCDIRSNDSMSQRIFGQLCAEVAGK